MNAENALQVLAGRFCGLRAMFVSPKLRRVKTILRNLAISGGILVEVVVYGSDDDYLCRISRSSTNYKETDTAISDAFVPPAEIGALWLRQCDNRWLVSGLVKKVNFPQKQELHELVYLILEKLLDVKEMAHLRIDRVEYQEPDTLRASMEEIDA